MVIGGIALPPLWYRVFPQPSPELPPAGRRVAVAPGTSVNVINEGHGQPIVLVHGHPGSAYDCAPLQHALGGARVPRAGLC